MKKELEERIKDSADMVQIVETLTNRTLKRCGQEYTMLCPFHDDHTDKNFFVNEQKKMFKCFACGSHGNGIQFVERLCGCNYPEALQIIADIMHIDTNSPIKYRPTFRKSMKNTDTTPKEKAKPISCIPSEYLIRSMNRESTLHTYLAKYIDKERLNHAFDLYGVGADKNGGTIYWLIDKEGYIRSGKIMQYKEDGHRNKDKNANWVHSVLLTKDVLKEFNFVRVPFGEHLLDNLPSGEEIAIVEAEKTAIIMTAICMGGNTPIKCWLGVGGKKSDVYFYQKLKPYKVHIYPDVDSVDDWRNIATNLASNGFDVRLETDWLQYAEGEKDDIADIVLRRLEHAHKEIQPMPIKYDWDVCNLPDAWLMQSIKDSAVDGMPF